MSDSQDALDTATAAAQHAAAIAAYNARQAGDQSGYASAIQQLYTLGFTNAAQATDADLLNIANDAAPFSLAGLFGTVEEGALIAGGVLLLIWLGPSIVRAIRKAAA